MKFQQTGHRRRPDSGITYQAIEAPYAIYHSDQVGGIPVQGERWLSIVRLANSEFVIGRKKSRAGAERACNRHYRAALAAQQEQERAEAERLRKKRRTKKRHRQLATSAS
jgi:hypothetical protein